MEKKSGHVGAQDHLQHSPRHFCSHLWEAGWTVRLFHQNSPYPLCWGEHSAGTWSHQIWTAWEGCSPSITNMHSAHVLLVTHSTDRLRSGSLLAHIHLPDNQCQSLFPVTCPILTGLVYLLAWKQHFQRPSVIHQATGSRHWGTVCMFSPNWAPITMGRLIFKYNLFYTSCPEQRTYIEVVVHTWETHSSEKVEQQ